MSRYACGQVACFPAMCRVMGHEVIERSKLLHIRNHRFQSSQEGLTAFYPLCIFIQSATLLPLSLNTKQNIRNHQWGSCQ